MSKKIKLTLLEKIIIPNILKKEGSFEEIIINKDIKNKILISQNEIKEFDIKTSNEGLSFNDKGFTEEFEIEFTDLELNNIKDCLKKLQEDKKITEELVDLYKKIIIN